MHPNPIFRDTAQEKNLDFARETAFGVLVLNGPVEPMLSHVPFLLSEDGSAAELHLVRSNPVARALKVAGDVGLSAKMSVSGPHSYVSPDWYEVEEQVPTWNYVAVHLCGVLTLLPQEALRDVLDRQSAFFEQQLLPKIPWRTDKMRPDVLDKMMRQIVPCRLEVTSVEGTWKMSQNKPDQVRLRAADQVEEHDLGVSTEKLAAWMRDL